MRYGYWLPVFGGWLRNVDNEQMDASWSYVKRLAQRSEAIGSSCADVLPGLISCEIRAGTGNEHRYRNTIRAHHYHSRDRQG
jgi:hypothetical protein